MSEIMKIHDQEDMMLVMFSNSCSRELENMIFVRRIVSLLVATSRAEAGKDFGGSEMVQRNGQTAAEKPPFPGDCVF